MKSVILKQPGEPSEVLSCAEVATPEPGRGQVRVRMIASPINPSDLMLTRGKYMVQPKPGQGIGYEGVGIVEKAGPGLLGRYMMGRRVAVLNAAGGNWSEYAVLPANRVVPVAADLPDEQVASFFVNPATVLSMVRDVLGVKKGDWIINNAAGSALGRMIIKLGRHDGFKTLNVVRRSELAPELKALGANEIVVEGQDDLKTRVSQVAGDSGIRFAIDPVGGASGSEVFESLAGYGHMLVYGTLSGEPLVVRTRPLIAGKRLEGFYLGHYMQARPIWKNLLLFKEISRLIRAGILDTPPGPVFSLDQIAEAVREVEKPGKQGKVLLKISG
ncbi:MAG: zinc-dependent alcohol dehydrogenase family protein [Isosphaeraceae bacterium]